MTGNPVGGVPSAAWPLTPVGGGAHASAAVGPPAAAVGPPAGTADRTGTTEGAFAGTSDGTGATAPDAAWTPSTPSRTPVPDPDALHLLSPAPEAGTLVDEGVVVRRGDASSSCSTRFGHWPSVLAAQGTRRLSSRPRVTPRRRCSRSLE